MIVECCLFLSFAVYYVKGEANPYDIPYMYGRNTMSTRGRILLSNEPIGIALVNTVVAFFEENNDNGIEIQMWYGRDAENYTLDWVFRYQPTGENGRTVIPLPERSHFAITSSHRLGFYSLADPCPILYQVTETPKMLFSREGYLESRGPDIRDNVMFDLLLFPVRFAIGVCNTTECDILPLPTTTPSTPSTTHRSTSSPTIVQHVQAQSDSENAQFLKEDIVLGLMVWLIILSFVVFAIFFLLICLLFRPKEKPPAEEGDQVGDWWVSVDDNQHNNRPTKATSNQVAPGPSVTENGVTE